MERIHRIHPCSTATPRVGSKVHLADFRQDEYSASLLRQYSGDQTLIPVVVSADGNCFLTLSELRSLAQNGMQLNCKCVAANTLLKTWMS